MARFSSRCHGRGVAGAPSVVNSVQARSALLQGPAPRDRGRFPFTDAADADLSVSLTYFALTVRIDLRKRQSAQR